MSEEKRGRGRPQKYPWDRWTDGEWHYPKKGVDFDCSLVSFRALVHRTATDRGGKAETKLDKRNEVVAFCIRLS